MAKLTSNGNKRFRSYLSNSSWLISDSLLTNLFGLLVLAMVARYLGPGDYGAYAYVFSLAQLFSVLGQMGLDGLLTRELVDNKDDQGAVLGTAGALRFGGYAVGAIGCVLYGFGLPGHSDTERWLFIWASLFILITPGPILLENWFRSRVEARYSSLSRMFGTLLGGGLKIILVLFGAGVVAVGFAQVLTVVIIFLVSLPLFLRRGGPPLLQWRFVPERAKAMLGESWTVFIGSFLAVIYLKIDQVMLRWWESADVVGIYAVAARMSEVFYFIPAAIVTTLFPRLIQLHKESVERYNEKITLLLSMLTIISYATLVGTYVVGPLLIVTVFGQAYADAVPVLMIHMLSMPFIFMRYAFSRWMLIEKFTFFSIVSQGLGAACNVLLNVILIPKFGMMGAAIATLASYSFASYFALLFSARTRPMFFMMTKALFLPWRPLLCELQSRSGIKQ